MENLINDLVNSGKTIWTLYFDSTQDCIIVPIETALKIAYEGKSFSFEDKKVQRIFLNHIGNDFYDLLNSVNNDLDVDKLSPPIIGYKIFVDGQSELSCDFEFLDGLHRIELASLLDIKTIPIRLKFLS